MLKRFFHALMLLALCAGMFAFTPATPVTASAESKGVSPAGILNPDGTLKMDANFRGALDLEGYNVQLDPALGPVFTPIAALDNWAAVAPGGGAFTTGISTILVNGSDVYVGGDFQNAGGIPEADYIAKWDGSNWTALSGNGSGDGAVSGTLNALLMAGGNLYVGGWFSVYDTSGSEITNASKLAKWNGSVWSAVPGIMTPLSDTVYALGFDATANILYAAGAFTDMNGNGAADYLAGIDFDTSSLVTLGSNGGGNGSLNGRVNAIGVDSNGKVYAGGWFTNVNNSGTSILEADFIAKWDGANWSALGSNGSGDGALNNVVNAIAVDGSNNVYVGGAFSEAAGFAEADCIAKWNGSAWSALGSNGAGDGALTNYVREIVISGSDIYVGGDFTNAAGILTADYAARFNTGSNAWNNLGSNGALNGSLNGIVYGMAYSGGNLYLSGDFYNVNNSGTVLPTADYFAFWNGSAWSTLGNSNGGINSHVTAIAAIGTDVYVGGSFSNVGGDPRMDNLIRWDGNSWNPVGNLTQTTGSLDSTVNVLAVDGADLYVGGYFTIAYNEGVSVPVNRIAKWDGSTWSALGSGVNNAVFALAVDASHNVYVGGFFTDAASIPEADYIAKWNGSAWSALSGNGASNGALSSAVFALAVSGSNLYVGGQFTSTVDTSNTAIPNAAYFAKWNGSAWLAMDGITSPLNDNVYALTVSGGNLYAGGEFDNLNGNADADSIAKWDGANWSALGSISIPGVIRAIVVNGSDVFVGGTFNNASGIAEADYVARWDGSNWQALGSNGGGDGSLNNVVYAMQIVDSDLWAGGFFENVNNGGTSIPEADYLAAYGIDLTPPTVLSITRAEPNPTAAAAVDFTVTFSESVIGVDASDFTLTTSGVSGAIITPLNDSDSVFMVTVNTGNGSGTLRLDLKASGTGITDTVGNPISGGFTTGQVYTIKKSITFKSDGANDGWILESTETSGVGGTMNSTTTTFNLGDNNLRKQYRGILSFDTSSLPDNATITKVTLKIKKQGLSGTDPFIILGGLTVDMRKPSFGALALGLTDFQSAAGRTAVATFDPTPVLNWFSAILNSSGKNYVNKTGTTQFRLRFATDDNNNAVADFMKFFSGNAATGARPQLIVEYKVP